MAPAQVFWFHALEQQESESKKIVRAFSPSLTPHTRPLTHCSHGAGAGDYDGDGDSDGDGFGNGDDEVDGNSDGDGGYGK
jgi:hypothetical protein